MVIDVISIGVIMMNIPNTLTIIRLVLIPIFILIFFSGLSNSILISIIIFFIAGFTDILDGYIARKYNMITKWGIVLDPLADKLMLLTVLSCLTISGYIPLWIVVIMAIKEISMIAGGVFLYNKDQVIPANRIGKLSTFLFYLSILILTFNHDLGKYLVYSAVVCAILAYFNYLLIYIGRKHHTKA